MQIRLEQPGGDGTDKAVRLQRLVAEIERCQRCAGLPLGPRPVVRLSTTLRVLIISQAPSVKVHESGLPFNDVSGDRLRTWLGMSRDTFYDVSRVGCMPMGFCYPGRMPGRGGREFSPGDAPPRRECAPHWHPQLRELLPDNALLLLVGQYAQAAYLPEEWLDLNVTRRCERWLAEAECGMDNRVVPMVHPSPRNKLWCARNPWFEAEMMPRVRSLIAAAM